jgi:HEAT repeat protein
MGKIAENPGGFGVQGRRADASMTTKYCQTSVLFLVPKGLRLTAFLVLALRLASAQTPANDFLDSMGMTQLKNYSSHRVSTGNRFVFSNDDSKRMMPGETLEVANLTGPGMVTHIWLTVAQNEFAWPRLLRMRVYYDGHKTPSVDAPVGDFFGVGQGAERDVTSIMVRDSSFGRARNSYWPMPYGKSCRITLTNEGHRLLPIILYQIDYRTYNSALPANTGYFHAYYRQERPAQSGRNYAFLDVKGTGHYVGTVLSVVLTQISWFGEGDDLFYVDGAKQPQLYGTGTEDYFSDAWDLRDASSFWTGTPIAEGELPGSRLAAYRWHVPDPIAFTKSLWAGIEHSGWTSNPDGSVRSGFEERPDYFSSVAFWYQDGVNEGLSEPPYGDARLPYGNAQQIAVEDSLKDVTTEKGEASVLRDVDWAKDILLFKAEGEGSRINVPIDIPEAGRYEIVADLAEASDYGDYVALFDGQPTNVDTRKPATSEIPLPGPEVFRNYLTELYVARDRTLGMFTLTKGRHTLSFVCKGKDPRSVGYNLGINDVVLEKVPGAGEIGGVSASDEGVGAETSGIIYRGRPLSFYVAKAKATSDPNRIESIRAVGYFGADGASATGDLIALLSDSSEGVRTAAAASLSQIGPDAATAIPALAKALSDSSPHVRDLAAIALEAMGPKAAPAVPELIKALSDPVNYVRSPAADALGAIGAGAHDAVLPLAERLLLKHEDGFVLASAAYALGNIGPAAKEALPALRQFLDKRRQVRLGAEGEAAGSGAQGVGPDAESVGAAAHEVGAAAEEAILKIEGKTVPMYHQ